MLGIGGDAGETKQSEKVVKSWGHLPNKAALPLDGKLLHPANLIAVVHLLAVVPGQHAEKHGRPKLMPDEEAERCDADGAVETELESRVFAVAAIERLADVAAVEGEDGEEVQDRPEEIDLLPFKQRPRKVAGAHGEGLKDQPTEQADEQTGSGACGTDNDLLRAAEPASALRVATHAVKDDSRVRVPEVSHG